MHTKGDVDYIHLVQDRYQQWDRVNTAINLQGFFISFTNFDAQFHIH